MTTERLPKEREAEPTIDLVQTPSLSAGSNTLLDVNMTDSSLLDVNVTESE